MKRYKVELEIETEKDYDELTAELEGYFDNIIVNLIEEI